MPSPKFTIVIVNYNAGDMLQVCIDSLMGQTLPAKEVLIVDNASSDGSADKLVLEGLPQARLIRSPENLGFAGGNNLAVKQAEGDWVVLLNPDASAHPDWLQGIADGITRFPQTEMFACAQLDADDDAGMDGAGDSYLAFGFPWRGGFGRPRNELPELGECFSACGASMVIAKDRFLSLGGFDERFFCYCEDVDLGFRHRLSGGNCIFLPDAVIEHIGSAISGATSEFTIRHSVRNRIWTYVKNMPPLGLALTLPVHVLLTLYLYVRAIGKPHETAMRKGVFDALKGLGPILRSRREIARSRNLGSFKVFESMTFDMYRMSQKRTHVWPLKRP